MTDTDKQMIQKAFTSLRKFNHALCPDPDDKQANPPSQLTSNSAKELFKELKKIGFVDVQQNLSFLFITPWQEAMPLVNSLIEQ